MAVIQGLTHFELIVIGNALKKLGFDLKKDSKRFKVTASGIVVIPKGTVL